MKIKVPKTLFFLLMFVIPFVITACNQIESNEGNDSTSTVPDSSYTDTVEAVDDYEYENETPLNVEGSQNAWIYGEWACETPYGTIYLKFKDDNTMYDGVEEKWCVYEILGDEIHETVQGGFGSTYELDRVNHRIHCGEGYWATKIY